MFIWEFYGNKAFKTVQCRIECLPTPLKNLGPKNRSKHLFRCLNHITVSIYTSLIYTSAA